MGTLIIYGGMLFFVVAVVFGLWLYTRGKRREQSRGESHDVR